MPPGAIQPRDQRGVHRCPRRGVFANRVTVVIRDKQVRSRHGNAKRTTQPRDQRGVHRSLPTWCIRQSCRAVRRVIRDKQVRSRHGNAHGSFNPETSEAFTVAPDVVYSPIVPLPAIRDKQVRSGHGNANRSHSTPRPARRSPFPRRGVFANRAVVGIRDKQVRSRHGNATTDHSTPRPARRSRLPPTWCIRQSCQCAVIRDKQVRSRHGNATRIIQPRDQGGVHDCSRRGVFANRAAIAIRDIDVTARVRSLTRVPLPLTGPMP